MPGRLLSLLGSYVYPRQSSKELEKESTPSIITGRKGTGIHPRLEIRELSKNRRQWTLFILAFTEIQQPTHSSSGTQFVQMAGIHGLPYERWPGDPMAENDPVGATWKGYCNHASVLFPTWHRSCMLLIEQVIGDAAVAISASFNLDDMAEQEKWDQAARALRFPYWDWTDTRTEIEGLPRLLYQDEVTIYPPTGHGPQQIANPLAHYKFGPTLPPGFSDVTEELSKKELSENRYFSKWNRTYRWPEKTPMDPKEDYDGLNASLKKNAAVLRSQVALLFSFPTEVEKSLHPVIWDEFSNTRCQSQESWPSPFCAGSLESPHNSIHIILGGIGSMGDPDYAAFDPIFFLHHANVDRIYALWEHVYPEYWMGTGYNDHSGEKKDFTQTEGTWRQMDDATVSEITELAPFRIHDDEYWSSRHNRSLKPDADVQKYYSYPPVAGVYVDQPATRTDRERHRKALQAHFDMSQHTSLYSLQSIGRSTLYGSFMHIGTSIFQAADGRSYPGVFTIAIELVEHAFGQPYSLEVIHRNGSGEETYIGLVSVFTRKENSACEACRIRRAERSRTRGIIPVPPFLIRSIVLREGGTSRWYMDYSWIADALTRSLSARLVGRDGTILAKVLGGAQAQQSTSRDLPSAISPKMSLWSAWATSQADDDGRIGPYEFSGWREHQIMFHNRWIRTDLL